MIPISHVLIFSLILFMIGVIGIFTRRDAITVFLSVEIMLNAANVVFIGFSKARGDEFGHVAAFCIIALAAAEAAVGLALVIRLKHEHNTLDLTKINQLRG